MGSNRMQGEADAYEQHVHVQRVHLLTRPRRDRIHGSRLKLSAPFPLNTRMHILPSASSSRTLTLFQLEAQGRVENIPRYFPRLGTTTQMFL